MRGAALAAAVALYLLAAAGTVEAAISLSAAPSSATTSTTLNGVDQRPTFSETFTISGASQNGWRITAWAAVPTSGTKTLPALKVTTQPTLSACSGKNCTNPTPTGISWPVTLGTTSGAAATIYNAAANTGDGTITADVTFGVTVPANVLSGTYTTSITLTITNTGP